MNPAASRRPTLIQLLIIALPVGLGICVVIAMYLYLRGEGRSVERMAVGIYQKEPSEASLRDYIGKFSGELIGERNLRNAETMRSLRAAASLIEGALGSSNMGYAVRRQEVSGEEDGPYNLWVDNPGQRNPTEIVEVRVGYDSPRGDSGVMRNAPGVAMALELAHAFSNSENRRTIRFVFLVNEWDAEALPRGSEVYGRVVEDRRYKVVRVFDLDGELLEAFRGRDALSYASLLDEVERLRAAVVGAANR